MGTDYYTYLKNPVSVGEVRRKIVSLACAKLPELQRQQDWVRLLDERQHLAPLADDDLITDETDHREIRIEFRICNLWLFWLCNFPDDSPQELSLSISQAFEDRAFWGVVIILALAECSGSRLVNSDAHFPSTLNVREYPELGDMWGGPEFAPIEDFYRWYESSDVLPALALIRQTIADPSKMGYSYLDPQ
jgi:hypothetical protein